MARASLALALLLLIGALPSGCTSTGDRDTPPVSAGPSEASPVLEAILAASDAKRTPDGLIHVPTRNPNARLYVRPPRPHLQRYDKMLLIPAVIEYSGPRIPLSEREDAALRKTFEEALVQQLEASETWPLAERPDPTTMLVRASILQLEITGLEDASNAGSATTFVEASGGATIGFEVMTPPPSSVLIRYVERRRLPGGVYSGTSVGHQRAELMLRGFARDIARFLQTQYRQVREIEEMEAASGKPRG